MSEKVMGLFNHHYYMTIYLQMVKDDLTYYFDGMRILWHIDDLRQALKIDIRANN